MMPARHFYEIWETEADGCFPVRQFGTLPEFCKPSFKEGNSSLLTYIDGWEVQPTGDAIADWETGRLYADLTVAYARKTRSPAFIAFVLDAIQLKTVVNGNITISSVEYGFFQRIAQIAYCGSLN